MSTAIYKEIIDYKIHNPDTSVRELATLFDLPKSTIYDHLKDHTMQDRYVAHQKLSDVQEKILVAKIDEYASYGTLLGPYHIKELAERICSEELGVNWVSNFLARNRDTFKSDFFSHNDRLRIEADTAEVRHAFYRLVSCMPTLFDDFAHLLR